MFKKLSALFAILIALAVFAACAGTVGTLSSGESESTKASSEPASSTESHSAEPSKAATSKPATVSRPAAAANPPASRPPAVSRVSPAEELSRKKRKKENSDWRYSSPQFYNQFLKPAALNAGYVRAELLEGSSANADIVNRNPAATQIAKNAEFYIANFYAPSEWCLSIYYGIDTAGYSYVAVVFYREYHELAGLGSYATLTDAQISKYLQLTQPILNEGNCPSFTLLREMKNLA